MTDYFFSKLPQGHAVRSISKAAATSSLRSEPLVSAVPASTVDELRHQCAAVVWVSSDVYSCDAVSKLPALARAFLLRLFGLLQGGVATTQARRIDEHVAATRSGGGGQPSGNVDGGAGTGAGGASGTGPAGLGGALLTPSQSATLDKIPRAALIALLTASGMPFDAAARTDTLRDRCAVAAWAGERLRQPHDVASLPAAVAAQVVDAFGIPPSWKAEARDGALTGFLTSCRESPWAVDPSASHDLISADRSAIFRAAEHLQARRRAPAAHHASHFLSATEQAELASTLAQSGHSLDDFELVAGRWQLRAGDGGCGGSSATAPLLAMPVNDASAQLTLETQTRTLFVETFHLLTSEERKEQTTRSKATPSRKRPAAFPGDTESDAAEISFNPFSEWPWERSLKFEVSHSYSMCGRILRNALRWHNRYFTDGLAQMTWKTQDTQNADMYTKFCSAVECHRHDQALLTATLAVATATEHMAAIEADAKLKASRFPHSKLLSHIASRRTEQALELKVFLADVAHRVTEASKEKGTQAPSFATAAWIDFMEGWLTKSDKALVSAESLTLASAATGPSPSSSGTYSPSSAGPGAHSTVAKAPRIDGASSSASGGSIGGTPASTPMGPPRTKLSRICVFQQHIPTSPEIVGDALGVSGAPFCTRCKAGKHFFGECPLEWGRIGMALPGFADDGTRIDKSWCKNEPIKSVVTLWVKFLQDKTHFQGNDPVPAGVAGAPSLADFQARIALAPAKK